MSYTELRATFPRWAFAFSAQSLETFYFPILLGILRHSPAKPALLQPALSWSDIYITGCNCHHLNLFLYYEYEWVTWRAPVGANNVKRWPHWNKVVTNRVLAILEKLQIQNYLKVKDQQIAVNIFNSLRKELPRYFVKKRILQVHWKLVMGFECHQIERKPIAKEFWLDAFSKIPILSILSALETTFSKTWV